MGKALNPVSAFKGFELLGRYLKLWTDKVELNDVGDLADRIRAAETDVTSAGLGRETRNCPC
jgi:hypothetical protein